MLVFRNPGICPTTFRYLEVVFAFEVITPIVSPCEILPAAWNEAWIVG